MNKAGNIILQFLIVAALAVSFANCSTVNQDSPLSLVNADGKHPARWIEEHGTYAILDQSQCTPCHGENLDGGISSVSCSTASTGGQSCHANGPGLHTAGWLDKSASDFHALSYVPEAGSCTECHDPAQPALPPGYNCLQCHFSEDGTQRIPSGSAYSHGDTSGEHESFTGSQAQVCVNCHAVNIGFSNQESCHNCHAGHDTPYIDHYQVAPTSGIFVSECSSCHSISPPPISSAPVCTSCHSSGSPYTQTNCRSCHDPRPSTDEHGEHGSNCDNCHQGAGTGSGLNHFYDGTVDVVFSVSNFTYSGGRCSGSCHGESHNNRNW